MKKAIIIGGCIIAVVLMLDIVVLFTKQETDDLVEDEQEEVQGIANQKEYTEVIEDTQIQGMVEIHHNGYIYLFNGEHFGEYGFEMKEYTRANINDQKQKCMDYVTKKECDTNYIEVGDIVIGIGDLRKYAIGEADFDTKNNPMVVLKAKDYNKMKQEAIKEERESVITVGECLDTIKEIYLKYEISDKTYQLPFVLKFDMTDDIKIIGTLEKGKKVKVEYQDSEIPIEELVLQKIEVIEE